MNIIKIILTELAFIFKWKDEKYADWFMEWQHERVKNIVDKIDIKADQIKIVSK